MVQNCFRKVWNVGYPDSILSMDSNMLNGKEYRGANLWKKQTGTCI